MLNLLVATLVVRHAAFHMAVVPDHGIPIILAGSGSMKQSPQKQQDFRNSLSSETNPISDHTSVIHGDIREKKTAITRALNTEISVDDPDVNNQALSRLSPAGRSQNIRKDHTGADPFSDIIDSAKRTNDAVTAGADRLDAVGIGNSDGVRSWSRSLTDGTITSARAGQNLSGQNKDIARRKHDTIVVICILGAIVIACLVAQCVDSSFNWSAQREGAPRGWLLGLLLASYAMLIPGVYWKLFQFNLTLQLKLTPVTPSIYYTVTSDSHGNPGAASESTLGLIRLLIEEGTWPAAYLVAFYAIVVPVFKLILILFGESWRFSSNPSNIERSRMCIHIIQVISKWAAPDMLAYIVLFYLVRNMNHPPRMLSAADLDIGFLCYAVFCMLSTLASSFIRPPESSHVDRRVPHPIFSQGISHKAMTCISWAMVATFAVLVGIGMVSPCMALALNDNMLVWPTGPVPTYMSGALHALNLNKGMVENMNTVRMISRFCAWTTQGEPVILFAALLVIFFVILIPILDMLTLGLAVHCAALHAPIPDGQSPAEQMLKSPGSSTNFMEVSNVLHHLCMLDVYVMSLVVVVLTLGGMYSKKGLELSLAWGLFPLILAEIVHQATYYTVARLCRYAV